MSKTGTVEKHGKGWRYRFSRYADGKRRWYSEGGFATKTEARRAMIDAMSDTGKRPVVGATKGTTAAYLDKWLTAKVRSGKQKATYVETITVHVHRYLIPRIGHVPITKLTSETIAAALIDLRENGRTGKSGTTGELSPKTVRNIYGTLHKALKDGVKRRELAYNPADGVDLPSWERPDLTVWDERQAARFLHHTESVDDPSFPLWRVLLATGMRRGELLALRWSNVDLVDAVVRIVESRTTKGIDTPKTKAGRRTVGIDPVTVDALARLKDRQEQAAAALGLAPFEFVATDLDGKTPAPLTITRRFQAAAKAAGLPMPRLHDTRHTAATLALQSGVPIHLVSGRLGHAKTSTTTDIYANFLPSADRAAADRIGQVLNANPPTRVDD